MSFLKNKFYRFDIKTILITSLFTVAASTQALSYPMPPPPPSPVNLNQQADIRIDLYLIPIFITVFLFALLFFRKKHLS